MPRLLVNLRGKNGELKQLYSRMAFKLDLGESVPDEDLAQIVAQAMPDIGGNGDFDLLKPKHRATATPPPDTGRPSPCSGRFTANAPSRKNRPKRRGRKTRRPALPPPSRPRRRKSASRWPSCNA